MIPIGNNDLHILRPIAHKIKRLIFTRDNTDELWTRGPEHFELSNFINASKIDVLISQNGDMEDCHGASKHYS
jgi:hypothetical protein